jgi:hypothetical protein
VLVLETGEVFILAAKMTSHAVRDGRKEYELRDWQKEGLKVKTVVRLQKVQCLKGSDFDRKLGRLSMYDILQVQHILDSIKDK